MEPIRNWVDVRDQPTVVKLDGIEQASSHLFSSFFLTQDADAHSKALLTALSREKGCGMFLLGHYGSGKSHFLAYIYELIRRQRNAENPVQVDIISLLNFPSNQSLESILSRQLNVPDHPDRRERWRSFLEKKGGSHLLLIDELSEFLRSKPTPAAFHEDIRFLQFLGEWAMEHRFWLMAALQEQIEHTGDLPYELYRKIKDRFPLRFFLSTTHVRDIIAQKILIKKEGYDREIEQLLKDLASAFPDLDIQADVLAEIYPLHPATMQLLEEVRGMFSEARGMIDFVVHQLRGNAEREIDSFLDQPWGSVLSPDRILIHFRDLLEMQGEFQKYARQVFPRMERDLPELFPQPKLRTIAEKLMAFLVLTHLSPNRSVLTLDEALWWLLLKVTTVAPEKNRAVIQKVLEKLAFESDLVNKTEQGYELQFGEGELESLERWTVQAEAQLPVSDEALLDLLLQQCPPNLEWIDGDDSGSWHRHYFKWHFHPRTFHFCFGLPAKTRKDSKTEHPLLIILKPWERMNIERPHFPTAEETYTLVPEPISVTQELRECAALHLIAQRPMSSRMQQRYKKQLKSRVELFHRQVALAYRGAELRSPNGSRCPLQGNLNTKNPQLTLDQIGASIFAYHFPRFETFAPSSGPLPKDLLRELQRFLTTQPITSSEAPSSIRIIQEAYLVPMKLLRRRGMQLEIAPVLEKHELIQRLLPIVEHQPKVKKIYAFFQEPVFGLVPDQVALLLIFLCHLGEIELTKAGKSYRDAYETIPNPIQYDRIQKLRQLSLEQIKDVEEICSGLQISVPKNLSSSLHLKKAIMNLKSFGSTQEDKLSGALFNLSDQPWSQSFKKRILHHLQIWKSLEKGGSEFEQIQHFLFQVARPSAFIQEHLQLQTLPQTVNKIQQDIARFRDLFQHPLIRSCPQPTLAECLERLPNPDELEALEAMQEWISQANAFYNDYCQWYRTAHDRFWSKAREPYLEGVDIDHLLEISQLPSIGFEEERSKYLESIRKWQQLRCHGLRDLQFSPVCHCGFDGEQARATEHLAEAQRTLNLIWEGSKRFFQSPVILEKVKEWSEKGLDPEQRTLSYLNGKSPIPEIREPNAFREHLQGVNLVQEIPTQAFNQQFGDRTWQRDEFLRAVSSWSSSLPHRFRFIDARTEKGTDNSRTMLDFTLQLALKTGTPLPPDFRIKLDGMDDFNLADVSVPTLNLLDKMNLPKTLENTILQACYEDRLRLPKTCSSSSPVRLIQAWRNREKDSPAALGSDFVELAYMWTPRFVKLFSENWLNFIDSMANWDWSQQQLKSILEEHLDADWVVIDGMGIFLDRMLHKVIEEKLPDYEITASGIGMSQPNSTTDGFYRELLGHNHPKSFVKFNEIDQLLHQKEKPLGELLPLVKVHLEWRMDEYISKHRPKSLLIFADHGFRLAKNGLYFQHHGGSNLERAFPFLRLEKK